MRFLLFPCLLLLLLLSVSCFIIGPSPTPTPVRLSSLNAIGGTGRPGSVQGNADPVDPGSHGTPAYP